MAETNKVVAQQREVKERVAHKTGLNEAIDKLARFGGFGFLEAAVSGIAAMNPERKARREAFLSDDDSAQAREDLKNNISLWLNLLNGTQSVGDMLDKSIDKADSVTSLLKENQLKAVEAVHDLERSYRNVSLFYANTEADRLMNVSLLNASADQVTDLDNPRFINHVADELNKNYDKLDLRNNYSILVIPGYLKKAMIIERWARIAFDNKVQFFTDFMDLDQPEDIIEMFVNTGLASADLYKSNTSVVCNWPVGRGRYAELGEESDLRISPAAGLGGKVYGTLMSQITAGKKFGGINEVDSVAFPLKKSEISEIDKIGLIPLVNEYGSVMAFSGKTLFNGDNLGLQTYSVVRVFDHITKVLFDFLNRRAFENWTSNTERNLRSQIVGFMDSIKGPDRLVENFKIVRFEQDKKQKDRIYLDLRIMPYFPAKSFVIKLDGTKGDEGTDWDSSVDQE